MGDINIADYEKIDPRMTITWQGFNFKYSVPNLFVLGRAETLFTKEPDTIEWIMSFNEGDVFLDVGANVGMYTIFAALTRGVNVFAFEPESANFGILNKNILLNNLQGQAKAYPVALADRIGFGDLHLGAYLPGVGCHAFGDKLDYKHEPLNSPYAQGSFSSTIDYIVSDGVIPPPNHIKIDVDGIEEKVIAGAKNTLDDNNLKSVLIEINSNLPLHRELVEFMVSKGFTFSEEQVLRARRSEGVFRGIGNYVFRR